MKRNRVKVFVVVVILAFNGLTGSATAGEKVTVLLDWFINPDHAPLFVAYEKDFFKAQGLDVVFIAPSNPNDPPKLVAASIAIAASGIFGIKPTTRSPGLMPVCFKDFAIPATSS